MNSSSSGCSGSERGRCSDEQLVEREIRAVGDFVVVAQNVDTSSETTSSTRIISVVKNGSP